MPVIISIIAGIGSSLAADGISKKLDKSDNENPNNSNNILMIVIATLLLILVVKK